jgi:23S rRNA (pseudouridine1915-N3)-methyltransferase
MECHLLSCGAMNLNERFICNEYIKRLKLFKFFLKEIDIKNDLPPSIRIEKESDEIFKQINNINSIENKINKSKIILMDINGKNYDSVEFSKEIIEKSIDDRIYKYIIFIIGGAFGVNEKIKKIANMKISFGKNTWPHNLMKIMLLEQIFRSETIILNRKYHN